MTESGESNQASGTTRLTDPERLAAVRATDLLDAPSVEVLDRLSALAARLLRAPVAQVTLLEEHRSFWVSTKGLEAFGIEEREQPVEESLCRYVVDDDDRLLIEDTGLDSRARHNLSVVHRGVAAWAGAPIHSPEGHVLGTLCVLDTVPHRWSDEDADVLTTLAHAVSAEIALGVSSRRVGRVRTQADFQASLLRATHEATLDGVLVVSPEGRMLSWNSRFHAMWRIPPEVVRSGSDDAALASVLSLVADPDGFIERVRSLYANPVPARDEIRLRDGRVLDRYGTPLFGEDGTYHGYTWYVRDVSEQSSARQALEASEERYRSLVRAMANGVWYAAPSGELLGDIPAWRAVTGQSEQELLGLGWMDGIHPQDRPRVEAAWARAVRAREMFEAEYRIRAIRRVDSDAAAADAAGRIVEVRGVPLLRDGEVSEYVGVYVDVTELRAAEAAERQLTVLAQAAAETTRALQEVTAALSSAVTMADVLSVILEQGQARLRSTASGVALRHGDRVRYEVLRGYSADIKATWAEFALADSTPVTQVIRTGRPVFVESVEQMLEQFPSEGLRVFAEATGEQAMARLPLVTPSGVLGALIFGFEQPRTFTEDERRFVMALAGQCAQALERAQLYERERNTARMLQRSMLPEALPIVAGTQLSALCQSASPTVEVGGDWYDAVVLSDGRLAVVVGDVMGKGVRAASVMGQVRNALRGLVHADSAPAAVLAWLEAVVNRLGDDEELVTLVYGVYEPDTGVFEWGCAGHMPPLLIGPDAAEYVEGGESLPLGLGGEHGSGRMVLEPGEALMLFSDGLAESRTRPLLQGLVDLTAHARSLVADGRVPDAEVVRDRLTQSMVDVSDNDDVTVLLIRRSDVEPDVTEEVLVADIMLPQRAASAGAARAFVASRLREWGADDVSDAVVLCVSEVVTNAVVHAATAAHLSVRLAEGVVRVDVADFGTSAIPSVRKKATTQDTHGRGLLLVDVLTDRWEIVDAPDGKVVWFEVAVA